MNLRSRRAHARIVHGQREVERIENNVKSPTLRLVVAMATLGALAYAIFLFNPAFRGDPIPYALVILAESFIIFQALSTVWTILSSGYEPRTFEYHVAQKALFSENGSLSDVDFASIQKQPATIAASAQMYLQKKQLSVDVLIPVYGEDVAVIKQTAEAARDMVGLHKTYILDDGKSDDVKRMASQIGVHYIRRPTNENAKAGNINYALSQTKGDFFVILDADFVVAKNFLYETLPFFENAKVAFVQTPQHYDNMTNVISTGASYMQHVFYSLIQPGKNRFNAAFCVGTNVVFRRAAIDELGGMYDKSKSEDIWTSLSLHERGWQSIYIPSVLAIGKTPETIKAYSKQQLRWATGSYEILLWHNPLLNRKLTIDQRLQYFATTTYYFQGWALLLLFLLPPLHIYFGLTPIASTLPTWQWAVFYSSFYVLQIFVAFFTMGGFKIQTLLLAGVSFPIYVKAFWNALFKRDLAWQATNSVTKTDSPFNYIRIQAYILVFLLLTTAAGLWKSYYQQDFAISVIWNMVNTIVFAVFIVVAVREGRSAKRSMKLTRKSVPKLIMRRRNLA